ncbi:nitrate- and nitrite sensing domain-containing protein [Micromonospora olivasterospora]|uniref:histidine kinase n=1 Tax=Micromonospora olivasterospora TaxID=1880 RepID=A0A562I3Z0_MICOL|nr:ATP-binding protein [Micromonospora olivasterospora]TWH65424.1 signal transduction histidine kinase [Micromonospora olivasterospora]
MGVGPGGARGGVSNHARRRFDVRVVPHRRRSPLRLRDWRMGTKLTAVLVIPTAAFLVLAGVQTRGLVGQTTALSQFARQVGIGPEITAVVHQLQQERDRTAGELAELRRAAGRADRDAAIAALRPLHLASDRAVQDLRRAAEPLADTTAAWQVAYSEVLEAYDQVIYIRPTVPPAVLAGDTILGTYHRAVDALLTLLAQPSAGERQRALNEAVLRYVQLARAKEVSSRGRAELYAAARAGRYGVEDQVELTDLRAQQLTALGAFRAAATAEQIRRYEATAADPAFVAATELEEQSLPSGGAEPAVLPAPQWWAASEQRQELLRQFEQAVVADAVTRADAASAGQLRATLALAGGAVAVLLVAVLISVLIGRSIARSMRLLRGQALRIAQIELPEALDRLRQVSGGVPDIEVPPAVVRSLDEIGELAEAFVAVHRSAVGVAVEQATMRRNVNAMFVNLARRSQVLVERQLELLDELEREENDPDQLENLFKLDHLAARMRRNDESLLVLAGSESTRRWNRPVALGAVLLAAAAETEQYQRVRHEPATDLHLVGHVVGDLVHLFAELLENATAFSRPDTAVVVTAQPQAFGAVVEIADAGLGMSPAALTEANEVLATRPAADVAASERMGLFVVSHLAARHAVEVRLRPGREGLVARVVIPGALLTAVPPAGLYPPAPRRMLTAALAGSPRRPAASPDTRQLPVAGRRPEPPVAPRPARPVPVRAEDVLAPAACPEKATGGGWWTRQGPTPAAASAPVPPAVPVTGGINDRGLPVRVPMALLAAATGSARPQQRRHDPDPEAVGGMLSRLYDGVRRAEAEETPEIVLPPVGGRSEGGQQ